MNIFTYLNYCYVHFRFLFWMICFIFLGSMFTAFVTSYTIWPFFSYSMYSYAEKDQPHYTSVELEINGKPFHFYNEFPVSKAACIENAANNYIFLKTHGFSDKFVFKLKEKRNIKLPTFLDPIFVYHELDDQKIALWLKNYIESGSNFKVRSIKLNEISIAFAPRAVINSRKLIFDQRF